ncbi:MAG: DEAD/DEAH box helicase [Pseudoclavibacter sp.]
MPKRRAGGHRAPKDYRPRDGKAGYGRRGGGATGAGAASGSGGGAGAGRVGRGDDRDARGGDARDRAARASRGERAGGGASRNDRDGRGSPSGRERRRDGEPGIRSTRDDAPARGGDQRGGERRTPRVGDLVEPPAPRNRRDDDIVYERLEASAITPEMAEGVTFEDLGFGVRIVESLAALGAAAPFPIQVATIPDALAGRDVLARGRTGSGKTIAFGAALVERLLVTKPRDQRGTRVVGRAPRGLIVAPTRELALQIDRTVQPIARSVGLFTTQVYGGVPQQRQVGGLKRGVDIVIGTPGRVEDLHRQGHLDLSKIAITVLDEADLMCDLGFLESMRRILRLVGRDGQRMLFSATLDSAVRGLVAEFLVEPAVHEVAGEDRAHADIDHRVLVVDRGDRFDVLRELVARGRRVLVFARTRLGAEDLTERLEGAGVRAIALHGDLSQERRTMNLEKFSRGSEAGVSEPAGAAGASSRVLVATDVAARGLHVDDIDLVIQADAPDDYKTYLHRSGRTGRAGNRGTVVTLIPPNRRDRMAGLLERAGVDAPMVQARPGGPELDALWPGDA